MTPANSPIKTAADLKGHSLGIPGRYGSSWIMIQALLSAAGLSPDDLTIREYPDFGQGIALQQGQVDAATGFLNNEPVQLGRQGFATKTLAIDPAVTPLAGPGLIVGTNTLATKHDAIRRFLNATLHAMSDIANDPEVGLDDSIAVVPDLASDRDGQLAVLNATIAMWNSANTTQHGMDWVDADAWAKSLAFMRTLPDQNIPSSLTVGDLISQEFSQ